ncbi:hypothetical protein PAPYR_7117 [Paratrimastix pyriformis]|uniref:Uncharacterized protein n=1 Tax=Paratrimastix pyriformis TaxID=342808 RepID=A0ABQ8UGW9_9EUKA|nr:hypothetical protein PAPYR_7117 [Paratrimastix pyriformis]
MYVDRDPPEVPPLNPKDHEYPASPKSKPPDSSIKIELSCPKPFSFLPAPNPFDRLTKLNKKGQTLLPTALPFLPLRKARVSFNRTKNSPIDFLE